jgi:hypothetical protein
MADMLKVSEIIQGHMSAEFKVKQHSILNALAKGISEDIRLLLEGKVELSQPQGKQATGVKIDFFIHDTATMDEEESEEATEKVLNYMNGLKNSSSLISLLRNNGAI